MRYTHSFGRIEAVKYTESEMLGMNLLLAGTNGVLEIETRRRNYCY